MTAGGGRRALVPGVAAFAVGVAAGVVASVPKPLLWMAGAACCCISVAVARLWRHESRLTCVAILLGIGLAGVRVAVTVPSCCPTTGGTAIRVFTGTVGEARGAAWVVSVDHVTAADGEQAVAEDVLMSGFALPHLTPGDHITVNTTTGLRSPGDRAGADSVAALDRIGVDALVTASTADITGSSWTPERVISGVRGHLVGAIGAVLHPPASVLVLGIVFGVHQTLPTDVVTALQDTGLYHIVAVSGLKVIIAVGFLRRLGRARQWSRRRMVTALVIMVGGYVLLSGAGAAAVRSAIMAVASTLLSRDGRRVMPLRLLAVLAAVLLAVSPRAALDVGFQLSYLGTAGILLWSSWLAHHIPGPRVVREAFAVTLAAQLATLPVMASTFGVLALIGPVANAMVLPLLPPLMLVAGCGAALAMVWVPLGWFALMLAGWMSVAIVALARVLAALPGAAVHIGLWPVAWVAAEVVAAGTFALLRAPGRRVTAPRGLQQWQPSRPRSGALLAAIGGAVVVGLAALFITARPDGRMHISVLDTGASPAVLLRSESGGVALVGGGLTSSALSSALGRELSPAERRIDLLVVGNGERTASAGLSALPGHYEVDTVAVTNAPALPVATRTIVDQLRVSGAGVVTVGETSFQWQGLLLRCLATADPAAGVAVEVSDGTVSALLLGDLGVAAQEELSAIHRDIGSQLVVAPPGGALSPTLVSAVQPRLVAAPTGTTRSVAVSGAAAVATTGRDGALHYVAQDGQLHPG